MVKVKQEHFNQLCKSQRSSEHVKYTYKWDFIYRVERVSWFSKDNGFEYKSEGNIKCNEFNIQITGMGSKKLNIKWRYTYIYKY